MCKIVLGFSSIYQTPPATFVEKKNKLSSISVSVSSSTTFRHQQKTFSGAFLTSFKCIIKINTKRKSEFMLGKAPARSSLLFH